MEQKILIVCQEAYSIAEKLRACADRKADLEDLLAINDQVIEDSASLNQELQKAKYDMQQILYEGDTYALGIKVSDGSATFVGIRSNRDRENIKDIADRFQHRADEWLRSNKLLYQDCKHDEAIKTGKIKYNVNTPYNANWDQRLRNNTFNNDLHTFIKLCKNDLHSPQVEKILEKYTPEYAHEKSQKYNLLKNYHDKCCKEYKEEHNQQQKTRQEEQSKLLSKQRKETARQFLINNRTSNYNKNIKIIHNDIKCQNRHSDHPRFLKRAQALHESIEKPIDEEKSYIISDDVQKLISRAGVKPLNTYFMGSQFQHTLHEELISVIDKAAEFYNTYADVDISNLCVRIGGLAKLASSYNLIGSVEKTLALTELCWSCLDCIEAQAKQDINISEAISKAAQDFEIVLNFLKLDEITSRDLQIYARVSNNEWQAPLLIRDNIRNRHNVVACPGTREKELQGQFNSTPESCFDESLLSRIHTFFVFPKEQFGFDERSKIALIKSSILNNEIPLHFKIAKEASLNIIHHKIDCMQRAATNMEALKTDERFLIAIDNAQTTARLQSYQETVESKAAFAYRTHQLTDSGRKLMSDLGLNVDAITRCFGSEFQQTIRSEFVSSVNTAAELKERVNTHEIDDLASHVARFADVGCSYLDEGFVREAVLLSNFCFSLVDCGIAIAEGVGQGIGNVAHAAIHPIDTAVNVGVSTFKAGYYLGETLAMVLDSTILQIDPEESSRLLHNRIDAIISALEDKWQNTSLHEKIKEGTAFVVEGLLTQKLVTASCAFLKGARSQIGKIAQSIERGEEVAAVLTAEGLPVQVKIADKATHTLMEKAAKTSVLSKSLQSRFKVAIENIEEILPEVSRLNSNDICHILAPKHEWGRLVHNNQDWDAVARIMSKVLREGTERSTHNPQVFERVLSIGQEEVLVRFIKITNNTIRVGNGWIIK